MKNVKVKNVNYIMQVVADLIINNKETKEKENFLDWCEERRYIL